MKPAVVRALVDAHDLETLQEAATKFEETLENTLQVSGDEDGEILSHLLVAIFVKKKIKYGILCKKINCVFMNWNITHMLIIKNFID